MMTDHYISNNEQELIFLRIFLNVLANDQQLALKILDQQEGQYELPKDINIHPIFDKMLDDQTFLDLKINMGFK